MQFLGETHPALRLPQAGGSERSVRFGRVVVSDDDARDAIQACEGDDDGRVALARTGA